MWFEECGKRNGKGKEYFHDSYKDQPYICLKFVGEYLNGKRNGREIEYESSYKNHHIIFVGEYLNGKRNGNGKDYDHFGHFEGEYLNGERYTGIVYDTMNNKVYELNNGEGYIKEYYCNGKLLFEGEYLNGKRNGKVKEYYYNGKLRFEGEYLYSHKLRGKFYIDG